MNVTKLALAIPAAVVSLSLALTGCTHASEESASGGGSDASDNAKIIDALDKDEDIAKLVPAKIANRGTLSSGMAANYAPAEFIDSDGSTIIGFDIDYLKAMSKLMGLELTTANTAFPSLLPALGTKYDLSASTFTITDERLTQVNMVSYFKAGFSMAVQKGNPQNVSPDDLCGHKVAVQTGTAQETDAQQKNKKCAADGKKPIDLLSYPSQADATTNVAGGKADVLFADSVITSYAISKNDALEALGGVTDAALFGVATAKNDDGLSKAVQAATQKLIDDGTMKKLLANWGNESGLIDKAELNPRSDSQS